MRKFKILKVLFRFCIHVHVSQILVLPGSAWLLGYCNLILMVADINEGDQGFTYTRMVWFGFFYRLVFIYMVAYFLWHDMVVLHSCVTGKKFDYGRSMILLK